LCLAVTVEVIRNKVVVTMVGDCLDDSIKVIRFTECTITDGLEDTLELGVNFKTRAILVSVTQVLNILGQITKEEDVVLADFASDFNLRARLVI